ncbi:MAG: hypothetical protein HW383_318 [Candidatus Magasanikbacteria bacterium]|nr:hypothetical protein [Candidatus Magasanikbacteria bacterium]
MSGELFIVATPIGNRNDLSPRAAQTLKTADRVLAEDTRVARKLFDFPANVKLQPLHHHSSEKIFRGILMALEAGEKIALVSDAGTPGISDPGNVLIEYLLRHEPELRIVPIPGPSAVTALLSVSGFPTDRFLFLGFPPKKGQTAFWKEINETKNTVIFFEAVHRILKTLSAMLNNVGDVQVCVGRELTKMFETIYRGKISDVILKIKATPQKGEYVIAVRRR